VIILNTYTGITAKYVDPEDEIAGECIQIRALTISIFVFAGDICEAVAAEKVFSRTHGVTQQREVYVPRLDVLLLCVSCLGAECEAGGQDRKQQCTHPDCCNDRQIGSHSHRLFLFSIDELPNEG